MKKLKLKALELGAREILTRDQLKHVMGGSNTSIYGCKCSEGGSMFTNDTWYSDTVSSSDITDEGIATLAEGCGSGGATCGWWVCGNPGVVCGEA